MPVIGLLCCALLNAWSSPVLSRSSQAEEPLPVPLKLEFAIREATRLDHPAMLAADAGVDVASAELESADSNYDLESEIRLIAGYVDPNETALNQSNDDNSANLMARKTLYDFGVTGDRVDSAETLIQASRLEYELARQQQVVEITRYFLDVLLSDLKFAWDNESMAMEYVDYDKALERHALKQVSDVELLQKESDYQVARTMRAASETMQRTSRALLAVAINRPGELSTDLLEPAAVNHERELPDLNQLVDEALQRNITLQALRKRERSARLALDASSKRFRPTLDASFEAHDYSRNAPYKDDLRARLNLVIPLSESGDQRSEIARDRADWLKASADVLQYESGLRSKVAKLWSDMQRMLTRQQELEVAAARAEIELDKARGEYELERRATLGDAMVNTSRVRYQRAQNRYQLLLAWMQMNMLTGSDPTEIIALTSPLDGGQTR